MTTRRVADIEVVSVTLDIGTKLALFILLAKDGTVNRMGSGSPSTADGALFIGTQQPSLFVDAIKGLSDGMLKFMAGYDVPEKRGALCKLSIGLHFSDGSDDGFGFTYGSDSKGPPREIALFVHGCVTVTQSWYQEQRRLAGKPLAPTMLPLKARPWWRIW